LDVCKQYISCLGQITPACRAPLPALKSRFHASFQVGSLSLILLENAMAPLLQGIAVGFLTDVGTGLRGDL